MSTIKALVSHRTEDVDLLFLDNGTLEVFAYCDDCTAILSSINLNKEETINLYKVMGDYFEGKDTIVITKKAYSRLLRDSARLQKLQEHSIDNWSGYNDALTEFRSEQE